MARTAKRYKKNTEKKVLGIPVCMAAIYVRLSVDSDEKKSESIETQVTLIKEFIQKHNENPNREYEIAVYNIYSDLGKTGTNFDRPGFERMMNDVREGKMYSGKGFLTIWKKLYRNWQLSGKDSSFYESAVYFCM